MSNSRILILLLMAFMIATTVTIAHANPLVETLRPNQDVYTSMFIGAGRGSTHYDKVNETTPDGDSTYVYTQEYSKGYDLYGLPDIPSGYTINNVTVYAVVRRWWDPPAYFDFRFLIKTHNTVLPDPTDITKENILATESWETYSKNWTTNPVTNSPWTVSEVNDLAVGVQGTYGNSYVGVTQLYVEVDVTPQLPIPYTPFGVIGALSSMMLAFAVAMFCRRGQTSSSS
jgi:hypothetical protein